MAYPSPKHERLTAAGGETTLTLGAAPIGDGPILWNNGALIWLTTDYTISGQTVTFTSSLVAGHVISVYYLAAGTAPPPSSLGGVSALPTDFAGLQLWLRPEAITGLVNLAPVTTWADSSAAANNMTTASANAPAWVGAPFVDGKGGVRFDGNNRYMQLASAAALDLTGDLAIFVVVRLNGTSKGSTSENAILSKDFTRYELYEYQSTESSYIGGTANPANSAAGVLGSSTVYLLELHRSSGAVTVIKNAVQTASATNSASATGTYNLTLGSRPSALTAANALIGDVFEVLIYNQARSSTEKTSLRNYVAGRWPSIGL
jgi:hypothetical protein